jgi:hypothetical protein
MLQDGDNGVSQAAPLAASIADTMPATWSSFYYASPPFKSYFLKNQQRRTTKVVVLNVSLVHVLISLCLLWSMLLFVLQALHFLTMCVPAGLSNCFNKLDTTALFMILCVMSVVASCYSIVDFGARYRPRLDRTYPI